MKKEIKLTPKQQQVLETLANMLEKENYKQIPVSDIYCNMTAVKKVISPNWFDRTFDKLEELGLVEKENMSYIVTGGYKKGEIVKTYSYKLTELGFKYLGINTPNKLNTLELEVLQAILVIENEKAYEDEVKVNAKEVLDNLDSLSVLTRSTEDNLTVITHIVNSLVNAGYVKVIDNTNNKFTFRTTLKGYSYYQDLMQIKKFK